MLCFDYVCLGNRGRQVQRQDVAWRPVWLEHSEQNGQWGWSDSGSTQQVMWAVRSGTGFGFHREQKEITGHVL